MYINKDMVMIDADILSKNCIVETIMKSSIVRIARNMTHKNISKTIQIFYPEEKFKMDILNRLSKEKLINLAYKVRGDVFNDSAYKEDIVEDLGKNSIVRIMHHMSKGDAEKSLVNLVYDDENMKDEILQNMTKDSLINLLGNLYKKS